MICTTAPALPDWLIGRQTWVSPSAPGRNMVHKPGKATAFTSLPVRRARQKLASTITCGSQ
jgi:hypothetical protein